jgi:hypothetical protein
MTKSSDGIPDGTAGVAADVHGFYQALWVFLRPPGEKTVWMPTRCFVGVPGTDDCTEDDWAAWIHRATGEWRCDGCHSSGGALEAAIERGRTPEDARDMLDRYRLPHDGGER